MAEDMQHNLGQPFSLVHIQPYRWPYMEAVSLIEKMRRADIASNGSPTSYTARTWPHDGSDGRVAFACASFCPFGNHPAHGKRWQSNGTKTVIFKSGANGDGTVQLTVPCSATANQTTQGIIFDAGSARGEAQLGFIPNNVYVKQQQYGSGVAARVNSYFETELGYNGDLIIQLSDPDKRGFFNDGSPDMLICYWTTNYT